MVQPKAPKVKKDPEKDKQKVNEALKLLQKEDQLKERNKTTDLIDKLAVELKLWNLSENIRSQAKARRQGETRPGTEYPTDEDDPKDVNLEWTRIKQQYQKTEDEWAKPALESELLLQQGLINYSHAMTPLIEAFEKAKTANIPGVKSKASTAVTKLEDARKTFQPLSEDCGQAIDDLNNFSQLVTGALEDEHPTSLKEVRGIEVGFNEAIQKVRAAEQVVKDQVVAVNAKAEKLEKELESLIREMVAAAIAWAETEDVRTGVEVVSSLLNGTVSAVQALDSEPMSALAVQGLHSLIKGVCDVVTLSAAGIQSIRVKNQSKDVMDLIDRVKGDAFIQAKADLFLMGFTWLTEPLGLIPNVGAIVRGAINSVAGFLVGTIKKAAEKQAQEEERLRSGQAKDEFAEEIARATAQFKEMAKGALTTTLEGIVEAVAKPEEKLLTYLLNMVEVVLGPQIQDLLTEIIGEFDLVDKEQVRETVKAGRAAVKDQADHVKGMLKIDLNFGFDEQAAKQVSVTNLAALKKKGDACDVIVVASEELKTTRGVALLIGDGHSINNLQFVNVLLENDHGFAGTVVVKSEDGRMMSGELVFTFPDAKAKPMVKDYMEHYKNALTKKTVTVKP